MITNKTRAKIELSVGGRKVTIQGESFLRRGGGSPDFLAYRNSLVSWDDGEPLTEADKEAVLDDLLKSAEERGWTIEIE